MNTLVGMQASLHQSIGDDIGSMMKNDDEPILDGLQDSNDLFGDDFNPRELLESPLFNDSAKGWTGEEDEFGEDVVDDTAISNMMFNTITPDNSSGDYQSSSVSDSDHEFHSAYARYPDQSSHMNDSKPYATSSSQNYSMGFQQQSHMSQPPMKQFTRESNNFSVAQMQQAISRASAVEGYGHGQQHHSPQQVSRAMSDMGVMGMMQQLDDGRATPPDSLLGRRSPTRGMAAMRSNSYAATPSAAPYRPSVERTPSSYLPQSSMNQLQQMQQMQQMQQRQ